MRKKSPEVTISVIQELIRRQALKSSLAGRDEKSVCTILKFLMKYVQLVIISFLLCFVCVYMLPHWHFLWSSCLFDAYIDSIHTASHEVAKLLSQRCTRNTRCNVVTLQEFPVCHTLEILARLQRVFLVHRCESNSVCLAWFPFVWL